MSVTLTTPYDRMCLLSGAVAGGFIGNAAYTITKSVYEYAKCHFAKGHFKTIPCEVVTVTARHPDGTTTKKTSREDTSVKIVNINRRWDYLAVAVISSAVAVGFMGTAGLISAYFLSFFAISTTNYIAISVVAGSAVSIGTIFVRYLIDQIPERIHCDAAMVVSQEDIPTSAQPLSHYSKALRIYNTEPGRWQGRIGYETYIDHYEHPLPHLWIDKTVK